MANRGVQLKTFKREWFYYIDHKGLLYLEETEPKNFTSCLKDNNFLDFFFKNLRQNDTEQFLDYKYVSPCWGEMNFVNCYRFPIIYGGTLTTEFKAQSILQTPEGIMIHPIENHKKLQYGAFDTNIAMQISEHLENVDGIEYLNWNHSKYMIQIHDIKDY